MFATLGSARAAPLRLGCDCAGFRVTAELCSDDDIQLPAPSFLA
jgi:hypothetical protein